MDLTAGELGLVYGIKASHVRKILSKYKENPQPILGRPFSLTKEQENAVIQEIVNRTRNEIYFTQAELGRWVAETVAVSVSGGWVRSFLRRNADRLCTKVLDPKESPRLQVPRKWLTQYIELIKKIVPLIALDLLFNLDETGLSDWEDRGPLEVVVPREYEGQRLSYPVSRSVKHQSLMCLINAAGDAYCPLLIVPAAKGLEVFEKVPIRKDVDISLVVREPAYMNQAIFRQYIREQFFPLLDAERKGAPPRDHPALIFCDNCSAHMDDSLLREFADHWVIVITYPPHTSNIFQVLDRLVFSVLKAAKRQVTKDSDLDGICDHIRRVFVAYERSTPSETIRAAWRRTGFDYVRSEGEWKLHVNSQKIP
jgi:hypothetical protein